MPHNPSHILLRGQTWYYDRRVPGKIAGGSRDEGCLAVIGQRQAGGRDKALWRGDRLGGLWASHNIRPVFNAAPMKSYDATKPDFPSVVVADLAHRSVAQQPVGLAFQSASGSNQRVRDRGHPCAARYPADGTPLLSQGRVWACHKNVLSL